MKCSETAKCYGLLMYIWLLLCSRPTAFISDILGLQPFRQLGIVISAVCMQVQRERTFNFLGKGYFSLTLVEITSLPLLCTCIMRQPRCFLIFVTLLLLQL